MTRKEKMVLKRQVMAIMLHAHNDVVHQYEWESLGVRRTHGDAVELGHYRDKRFNKAATEVTDLASNDSTPPQSTPNPQQGSTIEDKLYQILDIGTTTETGKIAAIAQIQAIITTETTKARIDGRLEVYRQVLDNINHPNFKKYILELYNNDLKLKKAALQKEQK